MYLQIKSQKVLYKDSCQFEFDKDVKQYMVGFSEFQLKFSSDHHIHEIAVDVSDVQKAGNIITVTPRLIMSDCSGHEPVKNDSYVNVVVVALLDIDIKSRLYLGTGLEPQNKADFSDSVTPPQPPAVKEFMQAALCGSDISYSGDDHHVKEYLANTGIKRLPDGSYMLTGKTKIMDDSAHSSEKPATSSVIIYSGFDDCLLCGIAVPGSSTALEVPLGNKPQNYDPQKDTWQIGAFISSYDLSFNNGDDHHVRQIHVAITHSTPVVEDDKVHVHVDTVAEMKDDSKHDTNIPHNKLGGFILAFYDGEQS